MKEFINSLTGTRMFVSDDREAEYQAAGHSPVSHNTPAKDPGADTAPEGSHGMEPVSDTGAGDLPEAEPDPGSETDVAKDPAAKKSTAAPKRKDASKK